MGEVTPEEKAVIDAAIEQRHGLANLFDRGPLTAAVDALLASRERKPVAGLCNFPSPGGTMLCVLPNTHVADRSVELHEGRTVRGHVRRWKEIR